MRIEIEKNIDDLKKERFVFYLLETTLYLDGYYILERKSTKARNFVTTKRYERLSDRDSSIKESEVPFTDDIKKEAMEILISKLKCVLWSEKNK